LDVEGHLRAYSVAMDNLGLKETKGAHYYLLELNTEMKSVKVTVYNQGQLEQASGDYLAVEKRITNTNVDAVLVSADSLNSLKKAYPNYFVDTEAFINFLGKIVA
jgi:hypothetical protein